MARPLWGNQVLGRNRREYYPIPANHAFNVWPQPAVPIEVCYVMWRYADATGDWAYLQSRMSEIQALYSTYDNAPNRYGEVMGLIGMARIAEHFNNAALRDEAAAKAANAISASNFDTWLAAAQTAHDDDGHDWCYAIFHYMRKDGTVGAYFCPEVGRLIGTEQLAAARDTTAVRIGLGPADHARATYPGWFAWRGDYCYGEYIFKPISGWEQNFQGGENAYNTPDFAWTFFLLRAFAFGDSPAELAKIVDTPTCVGDLFYLQKLSVVIRAFGTRTWTDVRLATDHAAPSPVTALAVGNLTPNSVMLAWLAPGDYRIIDLK